MKIITFAKLLYIKFHKTNSDIIFFSSYKNHYSDSPKYISEKLHELYPEKKIVWVVASKRLEELPTYVIPVLDNSYKEAFYKARASIYIDNVLGGKVSILTSKSLYKKLLHKLYIWCRKKGNQKCYTTWHGTPLKRMFGDQVANNNIIDIEADDIEMIHGNSFTYGIMNHLMWGKIPMSLLGCPRNDILFNIDSTLVNTLRYRLNLPYDKKIILYAPSFRSDGLKSNLQRSGLNQLQEIDITKICSLLNKKFGEEWCFVCRFHYHVEKEVNWVGLKKKYGEHIKNGNIGDDMSEYLACTDILLTDVSSCMFDFALTRKPCFIYFPDLEYYSSRERGLYQKIEDLPFPCSTTFKGLLKNISSFDNISYVKRIENLITEYGYVDDGCSAERVVKFIIGRN